MIPIFLLFLAAEPTVAQRNDACVAMRGDRSKEAVMRKALDDDAVRACAGENLRAIGAVETLMGALGSRNAPVRAIAARELGALHDLRSLDALVKAARDSDVLVATAAVAGLAQYPREATRAALLELARAGGLAGLAALHVVLAPGDPEALPMARELFVSQDVPTRLAAIDLLGQYGEEADLAALRKLAASDHNTYSQPRGFGLMPGLNLSYAAAQAARQIEGRLLHR